MPVLGHHFTVAYFAVAPLYWLGGGPQLLDLLQTAALALSAVPIYVYAKHRLDNEWWALGFGVAWLLNPSVQWLVWEAWHPETMAIPFFLAAYVMAERGRMRWYWGFLVATLAWKEDLALAIAVLGFVYLVRGRRRLGLMTIAVAGAWFVVAYMIAMPHFNGGQNHAGIFYGELGSGPTDILKTAVTDPTLIWRRLEGNDALGYGRDLLLPWGMTALLAPLTLLIAVPQFFANALTNQGFFYDIRFHYVAIILAVLALASIDGIAGLRRVGLRRFGVGSGRGGGTGDHGGVGPVAAQHEIPGRLLAAQPEPAPAGARRRRRLPCPTTRPSPPPTTWSPTSATATRSTPSPTRGSPPTGAWPASHPRTRATTTSRPKSTGS